MPFYSPNSEYGFEKAIRNPKNRGRWDLKNTGQFHQGLYTVIKAKEILFKQRIRNAKITWIEKRMELANRNPIGITNDQLIKAQINNKPIIRKRLDEIINEGR